MSMIAVMGATGNTGRAIAETLLEQGEQIRVLGRSAQRLKNLQRLGAEVMIGDATDAAHLTAAFRGADAVYALIPPDPGSTDFRSHQHRISEAIGDAIRASGVPTVVTLGTIVESTTCPAAGVRSHEDRLQSLDGVDTLALHAGFFFENHFLGLAGIKHKGVHGSPIAPDIAMAMIATRDIAAVAAQALRQRDFKGFVVRELLGERDLTMREVTRILGERIGQPNLPYVQLSPADFIAGLEQMGLSRHFAGEVEQAFSGINDGHSRSKEGRRPDNTTPTRFEEFAEVLAQAYRAM
jgi:uncharacterized protein YbjT (DUF2867 family)